jgi:uncharacterized membrane protein
VFAIAITLLVLEVRVPEGKGDLGLMLLRQWPSYAAYVTSFLTIGIIWVNHHRMFKLIERTTHSFLMINIVFLMVVAFVPFPTAVVARNFHMPDARAATFLYGSAMVLMAVMFNVLWAYASREGRLLVAGIDPEAIRRGTRSYRLGPVMYIAVTLLAIWNPYISLAIYAALAAYWLLPGSGPGA